MNSQKEISIHNRLSKQAVDTDAASLPDNIAISVRNVSKMYPLYNDPRDRLKQSLWYALPKFLRRKPRQFHKEFWALRDISFELRQGESLGIVGRNGCGKSTLLQIIAGTLAPTWGEMTVKGEVAALLELNSGFNPEFTGRENVYMNGAIWGMTQNEIDDLYGEIVAFADIGQFIDQPVKLYSSGMAVRLAFAVQAFVPKQTLIIDEALAVGDAVFQRKCMAVLERFQQNGGTFVLVSHNIQDIVRHCQRCLLLSNGELLADGPSKSVTDLYEKIMFSPPAEARTLVTRLHREGWEQILANSSTEPVKLSSNPTQQTNEISKILPQPEVGPLDYFDPHMPAANTTIYGNGDAEIVDYGLYNNQHQKVNILATGRHYRWIYRVRFHRDCDNAQFGMMLKTKKGVDVSSLASKRELVDIPPLPAGTLVEASFFIKLNVIPGVYFLNAGISNIIDGELIYLHRLVDAYMVKVMALDNRQMAGIAYMEPEFHYKILATDNATTGENI